VDGRKESRPGHSDLARHWLGETEDVPEELLCIVQ
jgi:hypothetical protein